MTGCAERFIECDLWEYTVTDLVSGQKLTTTYPLEIMTGDPPSNVLALQQQIMNQLRASMLPVLEPVFFLHKTVPWMASFQAPKVLSFGNNLYILGPYCSGSPVPVASMIFDNPGLIREVVGRSGSSVDSFQVVYGTNLSQSGHLNGDNVTGIPFSILVPTSDVVTTVLFQIGGSFLLDNLQLGKEIFHSLLF